MTDRLLQLYETLLAWRARHGHPPTLAELAAASGLKQWQTYAALVGLRDRAEVRGGDVGALGADGPIPEAGGIVG